MDQLPPQTVDEYLAAFSGNPRERLEEIRAILRTAVPDASEKISYNMPTLFWHQNLVYYAVGKAHLGFYPTGSGVEAFKEELSTYTFSKGTIRFSLEMPLPRSLIERIAVFRKEEVERKLRKEPSRD